MQFYKYEGTLKKPYKFETYEEQEKFTNEICSTTERFNEQLGNKAYIFVEYHNKKRAGIGVIVNESMDVHDMVKEYLKAVEIDIKDGLLLETTFSAIKRMLQSSSNSCFIYDNNDVMQKFKLDLLSHVHFFGGVERTFEVIDRAAIYKNAALLLSGSLLTEELDRIYMPRKNTAIKGFPVHYLISTDDQAERDRTIDTLAQALFENKRINSRRLCQASVCPGRNLNTEFYDCLTNICIGGTFIFKYACDDESESDMADGSIEQIEEISKIICKYADKVQIILCLPRECTKAKDIFFANLGSLSFIEIKESLASGDRAKEYLNNMVKVSGLRTDKKLYSQLKEEHGYLASELREMYMSWYSNKIKTVVYSQYKDTVTVKNTIREKKPEGSAYDKLQEMIGLADAKKVIDQALDYYKAQKLFAKKGMVIDHPAMHMIFTGNPGTAKTTVARLFARIMKDNNLLSKGHLIEVGRGDLVGKYVGWTAPTVKRKFEEAKGGVLFIDEAYSLVDDRDGMYGDEAINTIVQEMENHRDDMVVIFAGYPDKMEGFINKNPGLRSRIAFHVPFVDYDTDSLCKITSLIAKDKGLKLTDAAMEKLSVLFDVAKNQADFGNGRYARNIIEKAKMAQASRLVKMDYESVTEEDLAMILPEDIEAPVSAKTVKKFGFSA